MSKKDSENVRTISPAVDSLTPEENRSLQARERANCFTTLIQKESLQCGLVCGIALCVYSVVIGWQFVIAKGWPKVPFLHGHLYTGYAYVQGVSPIVGKFSTIAGCLAIALGLVQTAGESVSGTWQFLLHRPISRSQVLRIKILTGIISLMACTAIPPVLYAAWCSVPGTHSGPFEWWMTEKFWQLWLTSPVLYLAAVTSGLFDARWYGVRLLPVSTCVVICLILVGLPSWWVTGLPAVTALICLQLTTVFHIMQTRNFS